jgi:hypothetical protein
MKPSLEWIGDTFENSWIRDRKKLIHSVGNVGQIKYVPV